MDVSEHVGSSQLRWRPAVTQSSHPSTLSQLWQGLVIKFKAKVQVKIQVQVNGQRKDHSKVMGGWKAQTDCTNRT